MDPRLVARLTGNRGLFTAHDARRWGVPDDEVARLLRAGAWVRVRRGVYTTAEEWASLDEYVGRPMWRARAAHLTMRAEHVLSHDSAARELGLDILAPAEELVHVTRPRHVIGSRTRYGVKHHGAQYHPSQVVDGGGIPCLDMARTAVDLAREHGLWHGVCACDSALRQGVTRLQLFAAVRPMRCWPGVRNARAAVELADPGAESVGESMARLLVLELGIGEPETQFEIRDASGWARCDLRVGRHLFEFDGRIKYRRVETGGRAVHEIEDVLWHEKRRQDWLVGHGLGLSRIVWADFWGEARRRARERLLREYRQTEARLGTSIADLRHLVVAKPPAGGLSA